LGPLAGKVEGPGWSEAFFQALMIALGLNFIHRHYVFLLVYGDPETRRDRRLLCLVAPALAFALAAVAYLWQVPGIRAALVIGISVWNVWHVIMQRYGLSRAYAGKAGGGLETRSHARRDLMLHWLAVVCMAAVLIVYRRGTLGSHPDVVNILRVVNPIIARRDFSLFVRGGAAAALALLAYWLVHEFKTNPRTSRVPRWAFLASTFALLGVFLWFGPMVGYLVFGVAHSVEYLAFVHHFNERRYGAQAGEHNLLRWLFGDVRRMPLLGLPLAGAYVILRNHYWGAPVFVAYYSATSMLHYLFDGVMWKLRRSSVRTPLGIASAPSQPYVLPSGVAR
jgi:hypothetical protein